MDPRQDVTLGEVRRLLERMDDDSRIRDEEQARLLRDLNGKVAAQGLTLAQHGVRLDGHDREIRDLKQSPRPPDAIQIPMTAKTLSGLALAVALLILALLAALTGVRP